MSFVSPVICSFTSGEWSPRLYGRVDLAKYSSALSILENMTLMPHGGATRRMGTEFIEQASSADIRLVSFVFNTEQAYVLEFTPLKIRFFRAGGYLAGKDIESPFSAEDIKSLAYAQSADVMYLCCATKAPMQITRSGADVFAIAPITFTAMPKEWTTGSWPSALTFHQQRLWFGGTPKAPQTIWASKTGDLLNFTTGTADDHALKFTLVSEQVNSVRWLLSQKVLMVGTSGGEWVVGEDGGAITPSNILAVRNSNYGSAAVQPMFVGSGGVYVSADNRRLRDLSYDFTGNGYLSNDLSLLAEHLTRPGIKAVASAQDPDGIIWCVLNDGGLVGCTYLKGQEVIGWHRHNTLGKFLSVCAVPSQSYTETWFAVERENGVCIERMCAPFDGASSNSPACWYMDSALVYEGEATNKVSGLSHLEGCAASVLVDGAVHPACLVTNGAIELDFAGELVLVGLPYTWRLAPMCIEGISQRGTTQGKRTRIAEVMARVYQSLGVQYASPSSKEVYALPCRDVDMAMDTVPELYTGDLRISMPPGWSSDARVILSGDGALPATILMLSYKVSINE